MKLHFRFDKNYVNCDALRPGPSSLKRNIALQKFCSANRLPHFNLFALTSSHPIPYWSIKMAPVNLSHRRTHNLLLISKLLSLRDTASPLTLLLDSLEQPASPLIQEYIRRAKV